MTEKVFWFFLVACAVTLCVNLKYPHAWLYLLAMGFAFGAFVTVAYPMVSASWKEKKKRLFHR